MGRLTSSRAWKPTKPTTGNGRSKRWPGTPRPSAMSSYHWPHRAERVACCPKDNGRRPHHKPPTGRQPSRGGKGGVCPFAAAEHARRPHNPAYGPLVLTKRHTLTGKFLGSRRELGMARWGFEPQPPPSTRHLIGSNA